MMAPSTFEAFRNCAMEMCSSDVLQHVSTVNGTMAMITGTAITIHIGGLQKLRDGNVLI